MKSLFLQLSLSLIILSGISGCYQGTDDNKVITLYESSCMTKTLEFKEVYSCNTQAGDVFSIRERKFRIDFDNQRVIEHGHLPQSDMNCSVFDMENWNCQTTDGSIYTVMNNGVFSDSSYLGQHIILLHSTVLKIRYWYYLWTGR